MSLQKRKAQNRAAQRAFRERKEKHLKDLETKVEELEKASEATNHENSVLRAQVDRMTSELNQYKQKLSGMASKKFGPTTREQVPFGNAAVSNLNDVNFQFEFPKFGMSLESNASIKPKAPPTPAVSSHFMNNEGSKRTLTGDKPARPSQTARDQQFREDLATFNGLFSPSMSSSTATGSRGSLDSANYSVGGATSSPSASASSHSNLGPSSSCGTSPEPFTQSPMSFKPMDNLGTIGEEHPTMSTSNEPFAQFANIDVSSTNFDWLAQQNGGQFDPQLFGDYREPQQNILSNTSFDDLFNNDVLDNDFFTPYNMGPSSPKAPKKSTLIEQIDAQKESPEAFNRKQNMNCNQIW